MSDLKISPDKTWVPVSMLIASIVLLLGGLGTVVWGAVWITTSFQVLTSSNDRLSESMGRVEKSIERLTLDGVSQRQAQQWIELFKARNTALSVPDLPR